MSELARLERDPKTGKLDHPLDGSKDVADGRRDSSAVRACLRPAAPGTSGHLARALLRRERLWGQVRL
ncbi:MAG: hypothetical protein IH800_17485 [Myxococcales bacterium]|nr:hypothetical protein [Myxococcales bacterium]